MGLVAALWNEDGQSGRLDPLSEAVIERTAQLQLGACTSETRRPLVVSHAPAPFELYLAELEVKAALCERDREKTDLTYADDLSSRLLATTQTKDPWTQLLQARIDLARGQPRLARAHRLMAAEYWQTADPHLPLVADLRDYVADDDPPLARLEGIEDAARP
jgi:hypothetical protein